MNSLTVAVTEERVGLLEGRIMPRDISVSPCSRHSSTCAPSCPA
jgi:hypothetical protein